MSDVELYLYVCQESAVKLSGFRRMLRNQDLDLEFHGEITVRVHPDRVADVLLLPNIIPAARYVQGAADEDIGKCEWFRFKHATPQQIARHNERRAFKQRAFESHQAMLHAQSEKEGRDPLAAE